MKEIKLNTANVELIDKKDKEKRIIISVVLLIVCVFTTIFFISVSKKDSKSNNDTKVETVINDSVTFNNFSKVKINMTYYEVKNIFGFDGELYTSSYGQYVTQVYKWTNKDGTKYVTVVFRDGIVYSKSQVGLY